MAQVNFETSGDGYWSTAAKDVKIVDMQIGYCNDEGDFGELRVYFDTADWNVNTDGLIYTDSLFLSYLQDFCNEHGLAGNDVDYSEQGMQGDNYVSLDVGAAFLATWSQKFDVKLAALALI